MVWAGVSICSYGLNETGRRVPIRDEWLDVDESFYWSYDEDVYARLY